MPAKPDHPVTTSPNYPIHPLLKWAGGKRQLLPALRRFYPARFHSYIEPFFGSGAVFFDLHSRGLLRDRDVVLIDSNADLIGCYETVRDSPEDVARELERLARAHASGGAPHYYRVRDDRFNPLRNARRRPDGRIAYTPELAAMLIYLNRTGFNGLFRLNARGAFNVPAGRYARPAIVNHSKLHAVADALALPRVKLLYGSFELARDVAGPGDFLYLRPAVRPSQPHGELHVVHNRALRRRGPGALAATGRRSRCQRMPGAGQQFNCRRNRFPLRHQRRGARGRLARDARPGPPRHQQQRRETGNRGGVPDHEHRIAGLQDCRIAGRKGRIAGRKGRREQKGRHGEKGRRDGQTEQANELGAGQPDELSALGTGVGHPQIGHERHEAARAVRVARRTDRQRARIKRRHSELPAGLGTGDRRGTGIVSGYAGSAVAARMPPEEPVIEFRHHIFRGGW